MKRLVRLVAAVCAILLVAATAWAGREVFQGFDVVNVVVNGQALKSDVPAVNFYGRTMLPVRIIAEAAGYDVKWDEQTYTATLTSTVNVSAIQAENTKLKADLAAAQRELATVKAQPAPSAPPVPSPGKQGYKIEVLSHNVWKNSLGSTWVYALIQNTGDAPASDPRVSMTATKSGQLVATAGDSLGSFGILAPGQKVALSMIASSDIPADALIEWTTSAKKADRSAPKLKLLSAGLTRNGYGWLSGIGTIKNEGAATLKGVQAIVAFLNAKGEILYAAEAYAAITDLEPGQTTSFKAEHTAKSEDVADVLVYVTGYVAP